VVNAAVFEWDGWDSSPPPPDLAQLNPHSGTPWAKPYPWGAAIKNKAMIVRLGKGQFDSW